MKIETKHVIVYAIAPALIAGMFSIAPKLYDIIIEPRANLIYSILSGPQIAIDGTQQKIVSIKISNAGKGSLTQIKADLIIDGGSLAAYALTNSNGLDIREIKDKEHLTITIPKIHPSEEFSISALLKSNQFSIEPKFLLRSNESLGKTEISPPPERSLFKTIQTAGIGTLTVFSVALFGLRKVKGISLSLREDAIFYIATKLNIAPAMAYVSKSETELTYMRFADTLLAIVKTNNELYKDKVITGLKCLLLINDIADASLQIIVRNLRLLQEGEFDENQVLALRNKSVSSTNIITLRDMIDELALQSISTQSSTRKYLSNKA
jgi:hypothetical protein